VSGANGLLATGYWPEFGTELIGTDLRLVTPAQAGVQVSDAEKRWNPALDRTEQALRGNDGIERFYAVCSLCQ